MEGNFLGIDWGEKEIGLALGHAETRLAVPLEIVTHDASFWERLERIIKEHEVGEAIVGVPEYPEAETMNKAAEFSRELGRRFPSLVIHLANEIFTSKMAGANLREAGKKGQKDHAEAARILLQSWLEKK